MVTHKVAGQGFRDLEDDDILDILDFHVAQLSEKDHEERIAFSVPEYGEDFYTITKRLQRTTSALKKGFQMADDIVSHFF